MIADISLAGGAAFVCLMVLAFITAVITFFVLMLMWVWIPLLRKFFKWLERK